MQRDILFIVRDLPRHLHINGQNVFMGPLGADFVKMFTEIVKSFRHFLTQGPADNLTVAGFRTELEHETDAVREAWNRLEGTLDGISLLTEEFEQKVCSFVIIREGTSADAHMKTYIPSGWLRWGPTGEKMPKEWRERNKLVADYILGFVNSVAFTDATSDVTKQLAYSIKMFRCGIGCGSSGIEYLCKFSALEGLVCGPSKGNKASLLKSRLTALVQSSWPKITTDVQRMWEGRCEASHQAFAFKPELQADLPLVEKLVLACTVFAMDHLDTCISVPELWHRVHTYTLPAFVLADRPVGMIRCGFRDNLIDYGLSGTNIGRICDHVFEASAKHVQGS